MSLVVEDGSGVTGANSYNTLVEADAYFANRNNTVWAALDPTTQKTPYLIQAVDFMQQMYRTRWRGWRHVGSQALDWPRLWVKQDDSANGYGPFPNYYSPTVIPAEIKQAQLELALRASSAQLAPDIGRITTLEKVGGLTVEYDRSMPASTTFRAVETLLTPFFTASGPMSNVGRR